MDDPNAPSCVIEECQEEEQQPAAAKAPEALEGDHAEALAADEKDDGDDPGTSQALQAGEQPAAAEFVPTEEDAAALARADGLKAQGNALYGDERYEEAAEKYWEAVDAAPVGARRQRAVYLSNLAAAYLKLGRAREAAEHAGAAVDLDPGYVKALVRRSAALEALGDPERALADARRAAELDAAAPGGGGSAVWAAAVEARLAPAVAAKQEALKEEMLGKLKELGNNLLGRFGMSLDNFKLEKDADTGGYSIKMAQ